MPGPIGTVRAYAKSNRPTLASDDRLFSDNPASGVGATRFADLLTQLNGLYQQLTGRNAALGYAGVAADGFIDASILRGAIVPEEVADDTAKNALTVVSNDIGRRLVRVTATEINYIAKAAGTGADKWQVYNSAPSATEAAQGIIEIATEIEALLGVDDARAITALKLRAALMAKVDPLVNARHARQALVFDSSSSVSTVTNAPTFGTSDFSVSVNVTLGAANSGDILNGSAGAFSLVHGYFGANAGKLFVCAVGGPVGLISNTTLPLNTPLLITYTRAAGVGTYYINGVADGSGVDTTDYGAAVNQVSPPISGSRKIGGVVFYNYALSADQVAALFATGAPDELDRNGPVVRTVGFVAGANMAISNVTADSLDFVGTTAYCVLHFDIIPRPVRGKKYRLILDLTTDGPGYRVADGLGWDMGLVVQPGHNDITFTYGGSGGAVQFYETGQTGSIANFSFSAVTALVATDPEWDGLGSYWPDVSGNGNPLVFGTGVRPLLKIVRGESASGIYAPGAPILSVDIAAGASMVAGNTIASVDVTGAAWGEWLVANTHCGRYYIGGRYADGSNNLGNAAEFRKEVGFLSAVYGNNVGLEIENLNASTTRLKLVWIDTNTNGRTQTVHLFHLNGGLNSALVK